MGTGLGPESYAIIEQGRIGQILSSKPSDRRLILEEAAGVSKFKTRKRLAEAKLESSRQNLARIADILEEVTKQVGSLKRQASKARRYKELHDELRSRLKSVLTSRLKALEDRIPAPDGGTRPGAGNLPRRRRRNSKPWSRSRRAQRSDTKRWKTISPSVASACRRAAWSASACSRAWSKSASRPRTLKLAAKKPGAKAWSFKRSLRRSSSRRQNAPNRPRSCGRNLPPPKIRWPKCVMRQEDLNFQLGAAEQEVESCRQSLMSVVSHAAELRNQLVQAEEAGLALERQAARVDAEKSRSEEEHLPACGGVGGLHLRASARCQHAGRTCRIAFRKPPHDLEQARSAGSLACARSLKRCAANFPAAWPAKKLWSNRWRATPTARRTCAACFRAKFRRRRRFPPPGPAG